MVINNQTLFFYSNLDKRIELLDIKTLTMLEFSTTQDTIQFCMQYQEFKCIEDIKTNKQTPKCLIYVDTKKDKYGHTEKDRHRVINMEKAKIQYVDNASLQVGTQMNKIINLEMTSNNKIRINWIIEQTPKEFKESIRQQYKEFQATMSLLKCQPPFDYEILGTYVIITYIPRSCRQFTIPSFVTSLTKYAIPRKLTTLTLLDGVEFIGKAALMPFESLYIKGGNNIKYIAMQESIYTWKEFKEVCSKFQVCVDR